MSYATVKAGLYERLATVEGLKVHLKYEPTSVQDAPALYSILDSFERFQAGQVVGMRYTTLHRLWIRWQDNEQAEEEMDSYVNAIPAAIEADPMLGARIASGEGAKIARGDAEWREIGGTLYRVMNFYSETTEKAAYQSGI